MKKMEAIHYNELLQVCAESPITPDVDLDSVDRVKPTAIHKGKDAHEESVQNVAEMMATTIEEEELAVA